MIDIILKTKLLKLWKQVQKDEKKVEIGQNRFKYVKQYLNRKKFKKLTVLSETNLLNEYKQNSQVKYKQFYELKEL